MLHYQTIDSKTLELLKKIQKIDIFKNLRLVGGTSLALQIGHRISIDIDLFGNIKADRLDITSSLHDIGDLKSIHFTKNISIYSLDNVKVDIVNYPYPWLETSINNEGIVLAGLKDIAAMKLAAIMGRGTKKDFIDIFFLLKKYSLTDLLKFYTDKYNDGSVLLVLKSLAYFDDADLDIMPKMLIKTDWETIKSSIRLNLNNYFKQDML